MMRGIRKTGSAAFKGSKGFFKKTKEKLFPDLPFIGLMPFAGAPGYLLMPHPSSISEKLSKPMKFSTGSAPTEGMPSRKIMDWKSIGILEPGERLRKNAITYRKAHQEVAKLLNNDDANHEYLAYEAAKLCSSHPEVAKYTLHIMTGACAEDYVFLPGESFDNTFVEPPKRRFKTRSEFSHAIDEPPELQPITKGLLQTIAKLWKKLRGTYDEDSINRPYFAHFYDPRRKEGDKGLNILHGDLKFQSALHRMFLYWEQASKYYVKGDKPRAFCALGHLIHLVQDLHVPAHVHNDIHGPTIFLGKLDSFETWCTASDHPHITRPRGNENVKIWDSGPIRPPVPDKSWNEQNVKQKITQFADRIAKQTQRYRSVDAKGTRRDQRKKGKLNDMECYNQGKELIPSAIKNSAQMIVNFLNYHERLEQ